ncbi:MAG: membrane protein insertion efficiency factor YidD [Myxococcales bacterium]
MEPANAPAPSRGWRAVLGWPLLALLWLYRKVVSPVLPPACRYYPSCSQYAVEAVTVHGPIRGGWLSARRLLRCHPWAPGGPDPVPPRQRPDRGRVPR